MNETNLEATETSATDKVIILSQGPSDGSSMESISHPEFNQPVDGSWSEFVGDLKGFLSRTKVEIQDKVENVKESITETFHHNLAPQTKVQSHSSRW